MKSTKQFAATPIHRLIKLPTITRAFKAIDDLAEETTREHITICEVPAPPFAEFERAAYFHRRWLELGLQDVHLDGQGNVIGVRRGRHEGPLIVVSAHLDTVFPPGTDIRVRADGGKLCAPGIGDNACALAALQTLIKTLTAAEITTSGTVVFLGTVGEEGEGNLRGVRRFFTDWKEKVSAFVALEGPGVGRIVHRALGSRRYRIVVSGPGGHSWGDFGIVNPIHPLAETAVRLMHYPLPEEPATSLSINRISGGQAVNAIPQSACMDIDVRSTSPEQITSIESHLRQLVGRAVNDEIAAKAASGTTLTYRIEPLGERPAGEIELDAEIVQVAAEATLALGARPQFECASTDANLPMSLGIPAIAVGAGGAAGNTHTLEEWYSPEGRELGIKRVLLIALALVGLES